MSDWQPIETAPRDGRRLLLHQPSTGWTWIGQWCADYAYAGFPGWTGGVFKAEPTHWMPLPSSPLVEERGAWWCSHCERALDTTEVFVSGHHDARSGGCGHMASWRVTGGNK